MVLKDCIKCVIYTPGGKRLTTARVLHTDRKITLLLSQRPFSATRIKTRIDFHDKTKGLIIAFCELVIGRNSSFEYVEPWAAACEVLEVKSVVQRQKDVRVNLRLEMEFQCEKGFFKGIICNLSAGGLYFMTMQLLEMGAYVRFFYCFRSAERCLTAKVIRAERGRNGGYGYGCRFVGLTEGEDADIRAFVYRQLKRSKDEDRI